MPLPFTPPLRPIPHNVPFHVPAWSRAALPPAVGRSPEVHPVLARVRRESLEESRGEPSCTAALHSSRLHTPLSRTPSPSLSPSLPLTISLSLSLSLSSCSLSPSLSLFTSISTSVSLFCWVSLRPPSLFPLSVSLGRQRLGPPPALEKPRSCRLLSTFCRGLGHMVTQPGREGGRDSPDTVSHAPELQLFCSTRGTRDTPPVTQTHTHTHTHTA